MVIGDIAKNRIASIESTVNKYNHNTSIELPEEISSLIVVSGPKADYWHKARTNRLKMLIRQGYLRHLLELARYCRRVGRNPAYMFARYTSKKHWDEYLPFITKLVEAARTAAEVARRLDITPCKTVYKAVWRHKAAAIQKAALAEEIVREKGGNRLRLFNWLCWNAI